MKVTLVFVPPGGGETDYQLSFDLPGIPVKGDYIMVSRGDQPGMMNDNYNARLTTTRIPDQI